MIGEKMSINSRDMLLESLASTIADYRQGEIAPIDAPHVERWLNQFDIADQPVILAEMDVITKRFYFSKVRVKEYIRKFIKEEIVGRYNPKLVITQTHFINIQTRGNSQRTLLNIVDEILQEDYGFGIRAAHSDEGAKTYVYIDDALYTGKRLCDDLINEASGHAWLKGKIPLGCKLVIYTIANHLLGTNYVEKKIRPVLREKGISSISKWSLLIDNGYFTKVEYLWPQETVGDYIVDNYVANLHKTLVQTSQVDYQLFRKGNIPVQEKLFSSLEARNIVERAFLKNGIRIIDACREPAKSMRPLGFTTYNSLGFGTLFVTYRNIANNCPLVLWWGDTTMPASHPFSMWHPLFPRKTNAQTSSTEYGIIIDEHPF